MSENIFTTFRNLRFCRFALDPIRVVFLNLNRNHLSRNRCSLKGFIEDQLEELLPLVSQLVPISTMVFPFVSLLIDRQKPQSLEHMHEKHGSMSIVKRTILGDFFKRMANISLCPK